jgi:KDO2-lipid IV(A) lauroyltransferase
MKRFIQAITFWLLLPWLCIIAIIPFKVLYKVSDICFYLVYYVLRYRRKIVWNNLSNAFTEKDEAERQNLEKGFYRHLCDLLLEYIKASSITKEQVLHRCILQNPEVLQILYERGRHIILLTGHQNNWEWAANAVALQSNYKLYVLYKPLSNPFFDTLVGYIRKRFGRNIIHQNQALRTMLSYNDVPKATAILADQAPNTLHQAYTMDFLNQPTYVVNGIDKLAKRLSHAVVYMHIRKVERGYYNVFAELLFEYPSGVPEHMITQTYMQRLEADIYQEPNTWLWSHNRWKHKV